MADYIFNVARLLGASAGPGRTEDVDAPAHVLDVAELAGPVRGTARFTRISDAILVTGEMWCFARLPCARCTNEVEIKLEFALDDQFVPRIDPVRGGVVDAEDRWQLDPGHNLDLSQVLAEGAISALPPRVVCPEQCERQWTDSPTTAQALDPRLAPLERLRRRMLNEEADSHG